LLLMIDNYDSFTFNIVQYLRELGEEVRVFRNDRIAVDEIGAMAPRRLVISPGPCTPNEAGITVEAIRSYAGKSPILGVCLAHQSIGQAFGGRIVRAENLMHGKTSPVYHRGEGVFADLPSPFDATRYHSLLVERESFPSCLRITAWTAEEEIMGLEHKEYPMWGVQFHPESILTLEGKGLLRNFLNLT